MTNERALPARVQDLVAELVRIDSTSGTPGEEVALQYVTRWLEQEGSDRGVLTQIMSADGQAAVMLTPTDAARQMLLFSGHIDVVPISDRAAWSHDPFGANLVNDQMVGRGTSDMKSGLAAAMIAVTTLLGEGIPAGLLVTTGEEIGCRGAAAAADTLASLPIGAVIVPESTAGAVLLGHRGALWLRVTMRGKAAHGSTPERGVNAIERAAAVIARMPQMPTRSHPHLGRESVNVGTIHAGVVPNIVPDQCEIQVDIRVVSDPAPLLSWWKGQPEVSEVTVELDLSPVWTPSDHPWVACLGAPISSAAASYFTDASVLTRVLRPGTPVVVWGPGEPSAVHTVNESVPLASVPAALAHYLRVGRAWGTLP